MLPTVCKFVAMLLRHSITPPPTISTHGIYSVLSQPRGAIGSGAAAVESAADSVVARSCGCVGVIGGFWEGLGWL